MRFKKVKKNRGLTPPTESHIRKIVNEWLPGWDFAQTSVIRGMVAKKAGATYVNVRGLTLIEIVMIMVIVVLIATIVVTKASWIRNYGNEKRALKIIKSLSIAAELYASDNGGEYPDDIWDLTGGTPPYVNHNYCLETFL